MPKVDCFRADLQRDRPAVLPDLCRPSPFRVRRGEPVLLLRKFRDYLVEPGVTEQFVATTDFEVAMVSARFAVLFSDWNS